MGNLCDPEDCVEVMYDHRFGTRNVSQKAPRLLVTSISTRSVQVHHKHFEAGVHQAPDEAVEHVVQHAVRGGPAGVVPHALEPLPAELARGEAPAIERELPEAEVAEQDGEVDLRAAKDPRRVKRPRRGVVVREDGLPEPTSLPKRLRARLRWISGVAPVLPGLQGWRGLVTVHQRSGEEPQQLRRHHQRAAGDPTPPEEAAPRRRRLRGGARGAGEVDPSLCVWGYHYAQLVESGRGVHNVYSQQGRVSTRPDLPSTRRSKFRKVPERFGKGTMF
eukprot:gene11671-biopygen4293